MQTWTFPAHFVNHGDEGYVATFTDVPEAITGADTLDETRALAADALDLMIRDYLAEGRSIPAPRAAKEGEEDVPLDPVTAARAQLAQEMARQKLTNVALAIRLGKSETQVRRMLNGHGGVRIEGVIGALKALGVRTALAVG